MLTVAEAWELICRNVRALPARAVDLEMALGGVLSVPVTADRDIPAADRAAMDGYAVRAEDIADVPVELVLCGEVPAGSPAAPQVGAGQCAAIYTGANVPPGADCVVMVEHTACGDQEPRIGSRVTFSRPGSSGQHIFRRGENGGAGDVLIQAGAELTPANIGICAAVGCARPVVHARPTVSVLTTGEELLAPDAAAGAHQLRDSNGPALAALATSRGFTVVRREAVADHADAIVRSLTDHLAAAQVIILTGGVSVGKYDLVPAAVAAVGATLHFHGVAMKPGKPQLFATSPTGRCIFGLPGNPLSCMTGFHELVLPTLRRLSGVPAADCRPVLRLPLAAAAKGRRNRQKFTLARLLPGDDGPCVTPLHYSGTADLVAAGTADGTVTIPAGTDLLPAGAMVEFRPWRPWR